ncbi:MAG: NAD(P)H-binding protein [Solirubrobacteraceae bacterium]|nr:NAD(P)H-binding protein [Solirubrobacteraceae bacterium]
MTVLVFGATGAIGRRLVEVLLAQGVTVRALVRRPADAGLPTEVEVVQGDVLSGEGVAEALAGAERAVYLVHSMGGGADDFAARDRRAAETVGALAATAGLERLVYLGGLESDTADSEHLRSRREVAEIFARHVPGTVHARAAMVIGPGSASFLMLHALVRRLPAMVCPRWIDTQTQPIAMDDVVAALADLVTRDDAPAEAQLGGADVLTYEAMMERMAHAIGRRPPVVIRVPFLTPRLSSYWVTLVTPVELGLVQPLVDGLAAEMVVTEQPPPGVNDAPMGFEDAVVAALA